jgi:hypothetical protein
MNISLRKANAIQNRIQDLLKDIRIDLTVEINEFEDATTVIQKANNLLFANDARRQRLLLALYNIRGLVGTANASSGIDIALTKSAFLDRRIAQLTDIVNTQPMKPVEVVRKQVEKLKQEVVDSRSIYGRKDTVSTSVVAESQVEQARKEILNLKKQKQQLNDQVLELNVKTEVPLSEDVVKTLTDEGLV